MSTARLPTVRASQWKSLNASRMGTAPSLTPMNRMTRPDLKHHFPQLHWRAVINWYILVYVPTIFEHKGVCCSWVLVFWAHALVPKSIKTGVLPKCEEEEYLVQCLHHLWAQGCEPTMNTWAQTQACIWVSPPPLIVSTSKAALLQ